jgi:hypothetical protein
MRNNPFRVEVERCLFVVFSCTLEVPVCKSRFAAYSDLLICSIAHERELMEVGVL